MMFIMKKFIGSLLTPLTLALLIAMLSALCAWLDRRKAAKMLASLALAVAYLGSLNPVGDWLLGPLERGYPPLTEPMLLSDVRDIVVLGATYEPRAGFPVTAALSEDGLVRIVEGIRLAQQFPEARLVAFGGAPEGSPVAPSAHGYRELARQLGVAQSRLMVLDDPLDTADEAAAVAELFGQRPFLLVTSAYHMSRAMRLMERAGARPIAAPTGHFTEGMRDFTWRSLLPRSGGLAKTERALHEYAGLLALCFGAD